ncbi:hypothetical protein Ahia01_001259400, partial [Argonauta hians]
KPKHGLPKLCKFEKHTYVFGQVFVASDKCNRCKCEEEGKVSCTRMKCADKQLIDMSLARAVIHCQFEGKVIQAGHKLKLADKCNICTCSKTGILTCTKNGCLSETPPESPKCHYDGLMYLYQQIFLAKDGCNKCRCEKEGKVACTTRKCKIATTTKIVLKSYIRTDYKQCVYNGGVFILGEVFVSRDKCNKCTCKPDGKVDCTTNSCHAKANLGHLSNYN